MKKISFIALMLFSLLSIMSCHKDTPEQVAIDFLTAIEMNDFDKARALSGSEQAKNMVLLMEHFSKQDSTNSKSEVAPKFEVTRTEGTDTIDCYLVDRKSSPKDNEKNDTEHPTRVRIAKVDGEWKVVDMPLK